MLNVKRRFNRVALICMALVLAWAATGLAGGADDSEDALRARLIRTARTDAVAQFDWADYDGDGVREAFAIISDAGWGDDGIEGEIWFVSPTDCGYWNTAAWRSPGRSWRRRPARRRYWPPPRPTADAWARSGTAPTA